ncbi:hypothetical protein BDZ89DRAFT_1072568 [Hymenopellis radicata]|nr:hypothetical protein BDZ89DRAFT_1072568 [Hymenopellis radicata]
MSRGGRGFGRGRGGFGAGNMPPMGLTHADIQALSRDATELYPPMRPPVMSDLTDDERKICRYQTGFAERLRQSQYFVVETVKSTKIERYVDKYNVSVSDRPKLKRKQLHEPFFPKDIFEDYFNPKRKKVAKKKVVATRGLDLSDLEENSEKSGDEASVGESAQGSDYDVDEEYDNDYAGNYFDNGEGDDNDDLGEGGDDGGGGGGGDWD